MMDGFTHSKAGFVAALIYAAFAIWVVVSERTQSAGGWISLSGMATWIVTFPVSAPFEALGMRPDYRKNVDMAVTIAVCALLVYCVTAGAAWLVRAVVFRA